MENGTASAGSATSTASTQSTSGNSATSSGNATATPNAPSGQNTQAGSPAKTGGESNGFATHSKPDSSGSDQAKPVAEGAQAQSDVLSEDYLDRYVVAKVDGQEERITVREALKRAQLEKVSHQRLQKAAELNKQNQMLAHLAKTRPQEFLKMQGIDPTDFAEATLAEKFEMLNMSPEQKKLRELEEYKNKTEKERQELQERYQEHQRNQIKTVEEKKLSQEIVEGYEASGLPKDRFLMSLVAAQMLSASKNNEVLTAKDAALKVKESWSKSARGVLEGMDAEAIQNFLGPAVLKKLSDLELKRVTEKSASQFGQAPGNRPDYSASGNGKNPKAMNEIEYRKWIQGL